MIRIARFRLRSKMRERREKRKEGADCVDGRMGTCSECVYGGE